MEPSIQFVSDVKLTSPESTPSKRGRGRGRGRSKSLGSSQDSRVTMISDLNETKPDSSKQHATDMNANVVTNNGNSDIKPDIPKTPGKGRGRGSSESSSKMVKSPGKVNATQVKKEDAIVKSPVVSNYLPSLLVL